MGAGIAEVFARNGFTVIGVEPERRGPRARSPAPRALHRPRREAREDDRGRAGRAAGPDHASRTELKDLADADFVVEAVVESLEVKKPIFRELDGDRLAGRDPRHQHLLAARSPRSPPPTPSPAGSSACTSSTPRRCRTSSRSSAPWSPRSRCSTTSSALVRQARQEPGRLRRQGRLHRQHAAVRLPQPRGGDVRGQVRHPRGHRRRDAVRLRLPDGPAGAARPDRPRHGVRDPRDDVPPGPRPAARAGADPQADGHRRAARPQDRPRLLHLRGARTAPIVVADDHTPVGRRRSRSCATTSARSASSAPAPWPSGIVEVFAKAGYDVLFVGRRRTRSTASSPRSPRTSTSRSSAAGRPRSDKAEVLARSPARTSLDDLSDVDLVVEAIAEDLAIKTTLFENLDEICKPGAILATTTSSPADHLAGQGHLAARRTSSACTSSTRRRS